MSEPHVGMMVTPNVRLVAPLGHGGMASVWVADHLALHTKVAVKFIASDLATNLDALARFTREAAAASQVKSPHVVQTFDHGITDGGAPYIVMELLEGRDLAVHFEAAGQMKPAEVVNVVAQLARALDRAHARGIVHRDIKPNNIFLCDAGHDEIFVKLLDFGIAKGMDTPSLDSGTKTGSMIGTPFYMSPEQLIGSKEIDFHSDLWSVGVVAFEALTGKRPFDADTVGGLALKIHTAALPNPSTFNTDLPPSVDVWFSRACARAPGERFGGAKEMADALALAITGEMPRAQAVIPSFDSRPAPSAESKAHLDDAVALARTEKLGKSDVVLATDAATGNEQTGSSAGAKRGRVAMWAGIALVLGVSAVVVPTLLGNNDKASSGTSSGTSLDTRATATIAPALPAVSASAVEVLASDHVGRAAATLATTTPSAAPSATPSGAHAPLAKAPAQNPRAVGNRAAAPSAAVQTRPQPTVPVAPSANKNDIF